MPRGSKPGERRGGRQKGTKNRTNAQREAEVQASGLTPLEYMLNTLRSEKPPLPEGTSPGTAEAVAVLMAWESRRMWAAKEAAPYVHPRLAAVEHGGSIGIRHEDALAELD